MKGEHVLRMAADAYKQALIDSQKCLNEMFDNMIRDYDARIEKQISELIVREKE